MKADIGDLVYNGPRSIGLFVCCFLARAPGSLAGGFLVAVAGRALFAVCLFLKETSVVMVLS